jgi:hypothetical protein
LGFPVREDLALKNGLVNDSHLVCDATAPYIIPDSAMHSNGNYSPNLVVMCVLLVVPGVYFFLVINHELGCII